MTRLTEIIKEDFKTMEQVFKGIVSNSVIGIIRGIYTPALMNTGVREFMSEMSNLDRSILESTSAGAAQTISALGIMGVCAFYSIEQGKGLEYFGALALTNIGDYLVHAYKRSKK